MRKICLILAMLLAPSVVHAGSERVDDIRIWAAPDNTRVVLDLSGPAPHNVFTVDGPDRVVIDVADIRLRGKQYQKKEGKGLIKRIRTAPRFDDDTRVVLDLHGPVKFKSFALKPNAEYGHRLVIDLTDARPPEIAARFAKEIEEANRREYPVLLDDEPLDAPILASSTPQSEPQTQSQAEQSPSVEPEAAVMSSGTFAPRLKVVAIDAGHGGEDPGARGPTGLKEKHVALDIAKRLARLVNQQPGMKAVLIRDGDYYIGLRERAKKARK
ncbi:MAG: AMIN domain-containing protein, partial [Salinisphaeraceae bacterium]|nr:AMIN domain-containing protein [Salinisphaeraceae bacterium]